MKKIISYSLWGNNPKYTIGAIRNAELAKVIYPGWKVVIHIANDVESDIASELNKLGAHLIHYQDGSWNSMFWRFTSADNNNIVISRDTDSRLSYREKYAVDDWLNGHKDFHIMRDHRCHAVPILGGMWGARNGILKGITEMIEGYNKGAYDNKWQVDQNFLREIIYPMVYNKSCVHDEFFENKPFRTKRVSDEFVGAAFNADETPCI